jgi:hypothetical protein
MKFHINLIVALLFCFVTNLTQAQDKSEAFTPNSTEQTNDTPANGRYQEEAIFLKTSFWRGPMYIKNGIEYRVGFNGRKIKKEFEGFQVAQEEFKKYQKQLIIGKVVGVTGMIVAIIGLSHWAKRMDQSLNPEGLPPSSGETGAYLGGMIVGLGATSWGTLSSNNSLQKAIFLRNQALCEGK